MEISRHIRKFKARLGLIVNEMVHAHWWWWNIVTYLTPSMGSMAYYLGTDTTCPIWPVYSMHTLWPLSAISISKMKDLPFFFLAHHPLWLSILPSSGWQQSAFFLYVEALIFPYGGNPSGSLHTEIDIRCINFARKHVRKLTAFSFKGSIDVRISCLYDINHFKTPTQLVIAWPFILGSGIIVTKSISTCNLFYCSLDATISVYQLHTLHAISQSQGEYFPRKVKRLQILFFYDTNDTINAPLIKVILMLSNVHQSFK